MMRVVSLEEKLLDVPEYQRVPIEECYVHTPLGLCGVTAGSTVAVDFEPAGPGSPPPAWPNSGKSVQAGATCGDRRRRRCCGRLFVLQLQWLALRIPHSLLCSRRNVWPTRLTARKWLTNDPAVVWREQSRGGCPGVHSGQHVATRPPGAR